MTSAERKRAVRELEQCLARIVARGWTLEGLEMFDQRNEDYQAVIRLSHPGYDVERKGVM